MRHGYRCFTQEEFPAILFQALKQAEHITLEQRKSMREFILKNYTWTQVTKKWKEQFERCGV